MAYWFCPSVYILLRAVAAIFCCCCCSDGSSGWPLWVFWLALLLSLSLFWVQLYPTFVAAGVLMSRLICPAAVLCASRCLALLLSVVLFGYDFRSLLLASRISPRYCLWLCPGSIPHTHVWLCPGSLPHSHCALRLFVNCVLHLLLLASKLSPHCYLWLCPDSMPHAHIWLCPGSSPYSHCALRLFANCALRLFFLVTCTLPLFGSLCYKGFPYRKHRC